MMKSKQINFFTELEDFRPIIEGCESLVDLHYIKSGLWDETCNLRFESMFEVPNVGFVSAGDWNRNDSYVVLEKSLEINIRDVLQRNGEMKFAIDQMNNPDSIELKLGGILKGKNVIVAGRLATISEKTSSRHLYKLFEKKIRKTFKKIDSFYVGNLAEEKLDHGWRLVTNEKLGKDFDLVKSKRVT